MKVHELKELTELSLKDLARKTGIEYKRILKLNKQTIEHSTEDYDLINKYLETIGNNVIEVDFKTKRDYKRPPFSFEKRGEINLHEYRLNKRRREREQRKEEQHQRYLEEFVLPYHRNQK